MSAREKIAYLKGLLDGLGPAKDEGQNKIFGALVEALDALSEEVEDQGERIDEQRVDQGPQRSIAGVDGDPAAGPAEQHHQVGVPLGADAGRQ